ncbi:MAG: hypothetical protein LBH20_09840, partial [Treponema sp.]|nr:hypothetical protein [Treponema sp.]
MNRGSIGFLVFLLSFNSCAAQQAAYSPLEVGFYEGLKKRQDGSHTEARACFEKALTAANTGIAAAAAAELMNLHSAGVELSAATMALIREKADGSWTRALDAVITAGGIDREKFLALLLNGDSRAGDEAVRYALNQWRVSRADSVATDMATDMVADTAGGGVSEFPFTEAEQAAIDGRSAIS